MYYQPWLRSLFQIFFALAPSGDSLKLSSAVGSKALKQAVLYSTEQTGLM